MRNHSRRLHRHCIFFEFAYQIYQKHGFGALLAYLRYDVVLFAELLNIEIVAGDLNLI
jgi:hypothetical protein